MALAEVLCLTAYRESFLLRSKDVGNKEKAIIYCHILLLYPHTEAYEGHQSLRVSVQNPPKLLNFPVSWDLILPRTQE